LLCTIGIALIAFGYYHLAEIEHEVGFEPPHKYITWMIPSRRPLWTVDSNILAAHRELTGTPTKEGFRKIPNDNSNE
jgi:hypothetical protein